MASLKSCPEPERLKQLLDGSLTESELGNLTAHLDDCAVCQQTMEGLSAGRETWAGAAAKLNAAASPDDPILSQALEEARRTGLGGTAQPGKREDLGAALSFLSPPDAAGHLGKLGHYEIHDVVGRGAFGIVLRAFDQKLHRLVAIKVLSPQLATSASARKRFIREGRAAAAVCHEHVVTIHAVEEEHAPPYLVMQYVGGISLQERIDRTGPLEVHEILRIGMQAAQGLAAAHAQGLVHRDIKPSNILLENGVERVKITDFGLARAVDDASLTQSGVVAGTPQYMAPEQARGDALDHRADLFSLGSVLYALCAGRPPFRASSTMAVMKRVCEETPRPVREINPAIPDRLADVVAQLLSKDPENRYQTAGEVAGLLGGYLADVQQPVRRGPVHPETMRSNSTPSQETGVATSGTPARGAERPTETIHPVPGNRLVRTGRLFWLVLTCLALLGFLAYGLARTAARFPPRDIATAPPPSDDAKNSDGDSVGTTGEDDNRTWRGPARSSPRSTATEPPTQDAEKPSRGAFAPWTGAEGDPALQGRWIVASEQSHGRESVAGTDGPVWWVTGDQIRQVRPDDVLRVEVAIVGTFRRLDLFRGTAFLHSGIYRLFGDTLRLYLGHPRNYPDRIPASPAPEFVLYRLYREGSDLQRLQGRWKIVSLMENGVEKIQEPPGAWWAFHGLHLRDHHTDGPGLEVEIDSQSEPKELNLYEYENGETVDLGKSIYRLEGDRLTICGGRSSFRPAEFPDDPSQADRWMVLIRSESPQRDATKKRSSTDAELAPLKRLVELAEEEFQRMTRLHKAGGTSAGELDQAEIDWKNAQVRLAEAQQDDHQTIQLLERLVAIRQKQLDRVRTLIERGVAPRIEEITAEKLLLEDNLRLESVRSRIAAERLNPP
ncbi:MAG: protein kinase domain-containing protein [Planctomycetales bacterium]